MTVMPPVGATPDPALRAGSPFVTGRPLRADEPIFGREEAFRFLPGAPQSAPGRADRRVRAPARPRGPGGLPLPRLFQRPACADRAELAGAGRGLAPPAGRILRRPGPPRRHDFDLPQLPDAVHAGPAGRRRRRCAAVAGQRPPPDAGRGGHGPALGGGAGERATLLLYGQRRMGKTSTLLQLPRRLGSQVIPVFLNLQSEKLGGAQTTAGLLVGLAEGIGEEVARRGVVVPKLDRAALAADPYPAWGRWLDGVEKALGARTLRLCLDEYEALEEGIAAGRFDTRLLNTIRDTVQHRTRIAVLLSGSHQLDELPPRWASALISTSTLPITFLDEGDARDLILHPIKDFPAIYEPAAVAAILRVTHGQPYLVQLLCALLVERMNAAHRLPPASYVTEGDVAAVLPLALARGQGYFVDLWRTQTESEEARRVLEALAGAPETRLSRAALRAVVPDAAALRGALAVLLRREMITPVDDGYRITVPLVAEYARRQALV